MFYNPPARYPQSIRAFLDGDFSIGFHHFEPYSEALLTAFDHQLETYSRRFEASEKDGVITYSLILPGFKQSEVDVQFERETLTVVAKRGETQIEKSVHVGPDIDADKITAKLEDGILRVSLSKVAAAKPRKVVVK